MAELDARKLRILSAIVETYIATGEPVGSKLVASLPTPPPGGSPPTWATGSTWTG